MKHLLLIFLVFSIAIYTANNPFFDGGMETIGKAGLAGFEWTYQIIKHYSLNGDVIITIPTDANPDLIDSLAADYGKP
jgi:hypothetical protein